MLRVLSSAARCFAGSQSLRTLTSKPMAVSGEVVDQARDYNIVTDVLGAINSQITENTHNRLFAVVYFCGKQLKVTAEDMIAIQRRFPLENGDTIKLNKVMLAGSTDFTLIGKPLLEPGLVQVYATVIEKDLGHQYRTFVHKKRSRYQRSYFARDEYTIFRINAVELTKPIGH